MSLNNGQPAAEGADVPWMKLWTVREALAHPDHEFWKAESFTTAIWNSILATVFPITDFETQEAGYLIGHEYCMPKSANAEAESKADIVVSRFLQHRGNVMDLPFLLVECKKLGNEWNAQWRQCETQLENDFINLFAKSGDPKAHFWGMMVQGPYCSFKTIFIASDGKYALMDVATRNQLGTLVTMGQNDIRRPIDRRDVFNALHVIKVSADEVISRRLN